MHEKIVLLKMAIETLKKSQRENLQSGIDLGSQTLVDKALQEGIDKFTAELTELEEAN